MSQTNSALTEVKITSNNDSSDQISDSQTVTHTKYTVRTVSTQQSNQNHTTRTIVVDDTNPTIISCIWYLIKDAFSTKSSLNPQPNPTTFTPRTIAALIILISIFLGPLIVARILMLNKFPLVCACISIGVFIGLNVIFLLDEFFRKLPKYLVVDIGIIVCFIISPVMLYVVKKTIVLGLSTVAFAQFLFLMLILSGNLQTFRNQIIYVVVLLLLVFMSSFALLPGMLESRIDKEFHAAFFCIYGIILFLIGLPRIHNPAVCVTFVWFGIWFINLFASIERYLKLYVVLILILVLFLCFFIGLMRLTIRYSYNSETGERKKGCVGLLVGCWEYHKRVVEIDTGV